MNGARFRAWHGLPRGRGRVPPASLPDPHKDARPTPTAPDAPDGRVLAIESRVIENTVGDRGRSVRIPLGDQTLGESDAHRESHIVRRIKVEHRRFHAHGGAKSLLEYSPVKELDKAGEVFGPVMPSVRSGVLVERQAVPA